MNKLGFEQLHAAGLVSHLVAVPTGTGRWTLAVVYGRGGDEMSFVDTTRGEVREFASLDALHNFACRLAGDRWIVLHIGCELGSGVRVAV